MRRAAGLAAIAAAAFALRLQGWDSIAIGEHVVLPIGDAAYHARRALWSAQHWPSLLLFDPLVSFPDGAWIPWPPLHSWLVAGLARLAGGDAAAVGQIALWLPPLLGALAAIPVCLAAARLGGPAAGLGAAALFAVLPPAIRSAAAGQLDPGSTVGLLGATWLAAALAAAAPEGTRRTLPPIGVALARIGILLAAPASLAFVAVADGAQLAVLAIAGRSRALALHARGLAAGAAAVALAVPQLGVGGAWSASALSWLHAAALATLALAAAALAAWRRHAVAGARAAVPARILALWTAGFAVLALARPGFANELAAPAAVAVGVGVRAAWRALAWRRQAALGRAMLTGGIAAAALALLATPIARTLAPAPSVPGDPLLATPAGTLLRFAETVRAATPETGGFENPPARPAYGLLAPPSLGHSLRWSARRAVVGDGFGNDAGTRRAVEARDFWRVESEGEAVALAERLGARFVVTTEPHAWPPGSLASRLHREDGALPWEHFRLVAEGPIGGLGPFDRGDAPAPAGAAPYRLFEIVPGALIEAPAPPGTRVTASLALTTPNGRRFRVRAATIAADDGIARLRVPYPGVEADVAAPGAETVRALGPWRVRVGDVRYELAVGEEAVRAGTAVVVGG